MKGEDLQGRLTSNFLAMDGVVANNAGHTLDLMRRGILSPAKWDAQIAVVIQESLQFGGGVSVMVNNSSNKDLFLMLKDFFERASQLKENNNEFTY